MVRKIDKNIPTNQPLGIPGKITDKPFGNFHKTNSVARRQLSNKRPDFHATKIKVCSSKHKITKLTKKQTKTSKVGTNHTNRVGTMFNNYPIKIAN